MGETAEFDEPLREFGSRYQEIPAVDEPPKTTLQILERESKETYWTKFLAYFLDPNEPHGFGSDVLDRFIRSMPTIDYDRSELSDVSVRCERESGRGNRPDILVILEGQWFFCIEMKVFATEGANQTIRYIEDPQIGEFSKSEFPADGQYYVYLSPSYRSDASSEVFYNLSWSKLVQDLDDLLLESRGAYTTRGVSQLADFLDTVKDELAMKDNKFEERQEELVRLYVEYYSDIQEAQDAFKEAHEREVGRWAEKFIQGFEPDGWSNEWRCDPREYGQIYLDGWRLTEDFSKTDEVSNTSYRVEFIHNPNRARTFRRGELKFRLYSPNVGDRYRNLFRERFLGDPLSNKVEPILQKYNIQRSSRGLKTHLIKRYEFEPADFPAGYYETLRTAFAEFQELSNLVTTAHRGAVEVLREETEMD